jgi:hypothetical protein
MSPGPLSSQSTLHVAARRRTAAVSEARDGVESTIPDPPSSLRGNQRRHKRYEHTIELGRESVTDGFHTAARARASLESAVSRAPTSRPCLACCSRP